jgi:hypothetical protein
MDVIHKGGIMNNTGNQLYIEGENNRLYIYVHLHNLKRMTASRILDSYVEAFRNRDLDEICVSFWNTGVPGEHLSSFRKTSNVTIGKLLKGLKYINTFFDYRGNVKRIEKPRLIT